MFRMFRCALLAYFWLGVLPIGAAVCWYVNAPIADVQVAEFDDELDEPVTAETKSAPVPDLPIQQVVTLPQFKGKGAFEEALACINEHQCAQILQPKLKPGVQLASLPPVIVATPERQPPKKPEAWAATLDERQNIARNYLARVCPKILSLEKMQSAETIRNTNVRFMAAKSARQVIGEVWSELRGHSNVVWTMCPTEFYNKLFAQR